MTTTKTVEKSKSVNFSLQKNTMHSWNGLAPNDFLEGALLWLPRKNIFSQEQNIKTYFLLMTPKF